MDPVQNKTKAVFGPIPSRRLGRSLGIDLLPYKTCPLDCVYCECGATTNLTCERKEYYPTDSVLREIDDTLANKPEIDFITFSGVGEPTLHSGIGIIIRHVKKTYPGLRICLLTNAVPIGDMTEELKGLDVIVPSLDGSDEQEFRTVNRPAPGLTQENLVRGIAAFRKARPEIAMWLEIFIVPGVNDSPASRERFREQIRIIAPDKVQLNSIDRPGVVDWIRIPDRAELEEIARFFDPVCPTEIISRIGGAPRRQPPDQEQYSRDILRALRTSPLTARQTAERLGLPEEHVRTHLRRMEKAGLVVSDGDAPDRTVYRPA